MNFKIITAVFNAGEFFHPYADSIAAQTHPNMEVVVVDDASTDGTAGEVQERCEIEWWNYILQDENRGALYNQVQGIRSLDCKSDDVLVFVDGDDKLAHPEVLQRLEHYYETTDAKVTFGQYRPDPPSDTCTLAAPYPTNVMDSRKFREVAANRGGLFWNHLRTVKYEIFSQLTDEDFKDGTGRWYQTAADAAMMYPCVELAAPKVTFIPEVLLLYTSDNPISDWRVAARQCDSDHGHILRRAPKRSIVDGR